jgi:hypothetical protein
MGLIRIAQITSSLISMEWLSTKEVDVDQVTITAFARASMENGTTAMTTMLDVLYNIKFLVNRLTFFFTKKGSQ